MFRVSRFFEEASPRVGHWIYMYVFSRLRTRKQKTLVRSPVAWMRIVWDSVRPNHCSTSTLVAHSPSTAVYFLGPISQDSYYLSPQRNSSSLKCECNTVMYRYSTNPCAYLPAANRRVAQFDYGVHRLPKRHRPNMERLEGVLSLGLRRIPRDYPCECRCPQLGLLGL